MEDNHVNTTLEELAEAKIVIEALENENEELIEQSRSNLNAVVQMVNICHGMMVERNALRSKGDSDDGI